MSTKIKTPPSKTTRQNRLIKQAQKLSGLKSRQEVLDQALRLYVSHLEPKSGNGMRSFYDLTKHLAGSVEGPADLAHGKKHMRGFGR